MSSPYASLAIISGVYLLVMTAYTALEVLQSSINVKKDIFKRKYSRMLIMWFLACLENVLIFGNLISSVVLQNTPEQATSSNATISSSVLECGAQYCKPNSSERQKSNMEFGDLKLTLLIGCFLAINALGLLLAVFGLKNVERRNEGSENSTPIKHIIKNQIISIFKMIGSKDFIPLIPMSILLALPLALLGSAYAEAYVS
ncbi:DgyrCDS2771 [Dimorphilus gyrociliatus]|uniref:DgyrCDS2771 n=1 Tax=Dimorphilus gyrociliatus TaxID=2664684 RepID=A0A7I8VE03_9ANNE|nr:DgyrCDS2771 [Dimorphilus gyrociliatus]